MHFLMIACIVNSSLDPDIVDEYITGIFIPGKDSVILLSRDVPSLKQSYIMSLQAPSVFDMVS